MKPCRRWRHGYLSFPWLATYATLAPSSLRSVGSTPLAASTPLRHCARTGRCGDCGWPCAVFPAAIPSTPVDTIPCLPGPKELSCEHPQSAVRGGRMGDDADPCGALASVRCVERRDLGPGDRPARRADAAHHGSAVHQTAELHAEDAVA